MYNTINGWTKELMINAIKQGNNGTKSTNGSSKKCLYRSKDENKCAVGVFIPDDLYSSLLDNSYLLAEQVLEKFPGLLEFMPLEESGMQQMQYEHDTCLGEGSMHIVLENWINKNVED